MAACENCRALCEKFGDVHLFGRLAQPPRGQPRRLEQRRSQGPKNHHQSSQGTMPPAAHGYILGCAGCLVMFGMASYFAKARFAGPLGDPSIGTCGSARLRRTECSPCGFFLMVIGLQSAGRPRATRSYPEMRALHLLQTKDFLALSTCSPALFPSTAPVPAPVSRPITPLRRPQLLYQHPEQLSRLRPLLQRLQQRLPNQRLHRPQGRQLCRLPRPYRPESRALGLAMSSAGSESASAAAKRLRVSAVLSARISLRQPLRRLLARCARSICQLPLNSIQA